LMRSISYLGAERNTVETGKDMGKGKERLMTYR
jgi:hypothetical protein